jgi:DNA-binding NarL/FixJ family response regulator
MKAYSNKILIIESSGEKLHSLSPLLMENGYQIFYLNKLDHAIEKLMHETYDLVISENQVDELNGFEVFKILKSYIRNCGVPFFLILDDFDKEDMLIGLEMGIDNFIVSPINEFSVLYKIENHLRKKNELDIFQNTNFKNYFNSSSVSMIFVANNKIELVNQAFCRLNSCSIDKLPGMTIESIYYIAENKQNELNYLRFENGISSECKLNNVKCRINTNYSFNINLYRGNEFNKTFFGEIMPSFLNRLLESYMDNIQTNLTGLQLNRANLVDKINLENVKLTERECMVYELSAIGLPIKIIASKLQLSVRTVEKHRANIMAKTNAKNMIEAIVCIQRNGIKNQLLGAPTFESFKN